jgi:hypothetical protein
MFICESRYTCRHENCKHRKPHTEDDECTTTECKNYKEEHGVRDVMCVECFGVGSLIQW